jgi:SAM-dependent methyltransferase
MRGVEDAHWWYQVLHGLVADALRRHAQGGRHLLDAGCGTGGMLARLDAWETHGCDLSAEAVEFCRERGLRQVLVSSVHEMPYADGFIDVVLSLDVLYHARVDPVRALVEMRRVLAPHGLLVVNVPAFECLRGTHDDAVEGARRYRLRSLVRLLAAQGFDIVEAHYWNAWLFLPLWLRRLTSSAEAGDLSLPPAWLNQLLIRGGRIDAALCRRWRMPFGTSAFVVARRQ